MNRREALTDLEQKAEKLPKDVVDFVRANWREDAAATLFEPYVEEHGVCVLILLRDAGVNRYISNTMWLKMVRAFRDKPHVDTLVVDTILKLPKLQYKKLTTPAWYRSLRVGYAEEAAEEMLRDGVKGTHRDEVYRFLFEEKPDADIAVWIKGLEDSSKAVRNVCIDALIARGADAIEPVTESLTSKKKSARESATEILSKIGGDHVIREALSVEKNTDVASTMDAALETKHDPTVVLKQRKTKLPAFLDLDSLPVVIHSGANLTSDQTHNLLSRLKRLDEKSVDEPLMAFGRSAESHAFSMALYEAWVAKGYPSKEKWAMFQLAYLADDVSDIAAQVDEFASDSHHRARWVLTVLKNRGGPVEASWLLHWGWFGTNASVVTAAREMLAGLAGRQTVESFRDQLDAFVSDDYRMRNLSVSKQNEKVATQIFERFLIGGKTWEWADFESQLSNPHFESCATHTVFTDGETTFRYFEGRLIDADHDELSGTAGFQPAKKPGTAGFQPAKLWIAHPAELGEHGIAVWSNHFAESEILPKTSQFDHGRLPTPIDLTFLEKPIRSERTERTDVRVVEFEKHVWNITYRLDVWGRCFVELRHNLGSYSASAPLEFIRVHETATGRDLSLEQLSGATAAEIRVVLEKLAADLKRRFP